MRPAPLAWHEGFTGMDISPIRGAPQWRRKSKKGKKGDSIYLSAAPPFSAVPRSRLHVAAESAAQLLQERLAAERVTRSLPRADRLPLVYCPFFLLVLFEYHIRRTRASTDASAGWLPSEPIQQRRSRLFHSGITLSRRFPQ